MRSSLQQLGSRVEDIIMRLRRPKTLASALHLLVEPQQLRALERSCEHPGQLLEMLAGSSGFNAQILLTEVAALLGLRTQRRVHIPSIELLDTISCSFDDLLTRVFVPQVEASSANLPFLVISDPGLFQDGEEVFDRYELRLGLHSEIQRVCDELAAMRKTVGAASGAQLQVLFKRMVEDAKRLKASEVFVGAPQESEFEFHAEGRAYRGTLGTAAVGLLRDWMEDASVREMSISLASGNVRVFLCRSQGCSLQSFILRWEDAFA